ncbi:MAG: crossover junction endodeoxyribonuclease RuvC [Planctomycetes bacterium RBG_13_46_10]|nr:MAG: crossover junction endodeoxyribonuclease RuvC [Planctomycetes bacterium RBG_13_46_10]QBM02899.1 crossover junction endodeoxyribonuclease RuvC [uncultured archaeon]
MERLGLKMRILGIDPGLQVCGYAFLETEQNSEKLIEAGVFRTSGGSSIEAKLNQIAEDMDCLLERFGPEVVAVEQLYSHYTHPRTAILMGHARGVILQRCAQAGVEVKSFNATRIKKSLTGNGRASKEQVQRTIQTLLVLPQLPEPPDVADAIAAALCCANSLRIVAAV